MTIKESITVDDAIALLNEALLRDPNALDALVEQRIECNSALADHPSVVVADGPDGPRVGLLGILNGLFGNDERGLGAISAEYNALGMVRTFRRTPHIRDA